MRIKETAILSKDGVGSFVTRRKIYYGDSSVRCFRLHHQELILGEK